MCIFSEFGSKSLPHWHSHCHHITASNSYRKYTCYESLNRKKHKWKQCLSRQNIAKLKGSQWYEKAWSFCENQISAGPHLDWRPVSSGVQHFWLPAHFPPTVIIICTIWTMCLAAGCWRMRRRQSWWDVCKEWESLYCSSDYNWKSHCWSSLI